MGKKLNLSHLSEEECEQIMSVLQKDFEVRKAEKRRLNEVHDTLVQEQTRVSMLQQNPNFNLTNCIICLERFGFFSRRKRVCDACKMNICQECCTLRPGKKGVFVCAVCNKEKAYKILSNEWFRKNFHLDEKHHGSAKIVRSLYKRTANLSDTEGDSSLPHSSAGSAHWPRRERPRLDNVFDIDVSAAISTPKQEECHEGCVEVPGPSPHKSAFVMSGTERGISLV
ncbi:Rab effector myrip [Plakobranchus ocellatus]|uniref:Rab effector myrip n=1 Tax=Plakobranchus ocellatus TaxID=259542 RepID=A0AAV4AFS1_9GAST|nr:Rab effector myrip [Plakobranchus ocellatus]